jgi:NAD(P)-dependent dehydrogenase (short-subunit alcohol dehydrogenase family)
VHTPLLELHGRIALVTGGSRGLGRAMALGLAAAGADLVIASRTLSDCQRVATEITSMGRNALAVRFDAEHWDECNCLVEVAYQHYGRIDILVNNAGIAPPMPALEETDEGLFERVMAVNFKTPFRLATLVGSRMATQDRGGSIINIGSGAAFIPEPPYAVYGAAKAALTAMTRALARAYAPKVRVNVLSPGPFNTEIRRERLKGKPPDITAPAPEFQNALQRLGQPEELVTSALYLASQASSFTTGCVLRVDGGLL